MVVFGILRRPFLHPSPTCQGSSPWVLMSAPCPTRLPLGPGPHPGATSPRVTLLFSPPNTHEPKPMRRPSYLPPPVSPIGSHPAPDLYT